MKNILIIAMLFIMQKAVAQTSAFAAIDSLLQKGRYKIALQQLQEIQPPTFQSNKKMAQIYHLIDSYKQAVYYYEKALSFKEDYQTSIDLGRTYQRLKQYKKTISIYEEILTKDTHNLLLQYKLAKLYLLTKQPKKSVKIFQFLITQDIENANYSYQLGISYALLGKRNPKIDSYLEAYRKDNQHLKAVYRLAKSYKKIGDRDSSALFVEKGLVIQPNHLDLNKMKINYLFRKKQYSKAIDLLINIDSLVSNDYYTIKMLGRSYYNIDSLALAKKQFTKAKKLDNEDYKNYTYLGHIATKEKNFKTARFYYMMATILGKEKRDEEYYSLAIVYLELKEPKMAIKMFKKAILENWKNYKAAYQLAKLSDDYYIDKKGVYKLYKKFIEKFEGKDKEMTAFAFRRLKEIKKMYFLKGETLD